MPVIHFPIRELERLLGKKVTRDDLQRTIPQIGASVDDASGDTWAVEFFPDRPDLYTVEGVARALRAYYGIAPGLASYEVAKPRASLFVDPSVDAVRPVVVGAFVRDVTITEERLQALIELQEDLHHGLGVRRRKVAIGVHDAGQIEPPFYYMTTPREGVRFVPLAETREMTPAEILAEHPKGKDFAHLLEGKTRYPVIVDRRGQVLSLPPIINGVLTQVTTATTSLFLDVTGTEPWACERALNLLATSLAEAGGKIEAVTVRKLEGPAPAQSHQDVSERLAFLQHWQKDAKSWKKIAVTPDLKPERKKLAVSEVNRLLGTSFDGPEVAERLEKMGFGAKPGKSSVDVLVPPYRVDVMHEWDLVEDVAIGHGFNNLEPMLPRHVTVAAPLAGALEAERVRQSLVGLGFLEVMTLSLSNAEDQFEKMGLPRGYTVDIKNPTSEEYSLLRASLLPSLLHILKKNAHRDLPQRIFEVGVATVEGESGAPRPERRVAGLVISSRAHFSEAKGVALALARDHGWSEDVTPAEHPAFVPGRVANLGGRGLFGELHPRTIAAFGLGNPVVAFEFFLERLPMDVRGATD